MMTWDALASGCTSIRVEGREVDILKENEAEKYLGRKLCFRDSCQVELQSRLNAGWAAFHINKRELCNKYYSTQDRVRLFQAAVTPTVLYELAAWGLTQVMESKLRTTWRKMLRYMFRLHRRKLDSGPEELSDYMKRSAEQLEAMALRFGIEDWVKAYRRRKYRFAGKVARQTDGRWSQVIVHWTPNGGIGRDRGRPHTRWSDDLTKFAGDWAQAALDAPLWASSEEGYVS